MILVDTSVWADHFHSPNSDLITHLHAENVLGHPYVMGEVALGYLRRRNSTLPLLAQLAPAPLLTADEAAILIETHHLFGRGIGYVDVHLLGSIRLLPGSSLATFDRRLQEVAVSLGLGVASFVRR